MSQSSIDSIEENSRTSFCLVEQTRLPYANVETAIPSLIEAPYRPPHPHDEPSTADDEEEGELILQSAGSSSEDSNRIAPPSVNPSEIASNVSVSSSSGLGGRSVGSSSAHKDVVIVETTSEQSALGTDPEEATFDTQFQVSAGGTQEEERDPFVAEGLKKMASASLKPEIPTDSTVPPIGTLPEPKEMAECDDAEDKLPKRVKGIGKCLNPVTLSVVVGASMFCFGMMTFGWTQKSTGGKMEEPSIRNPLNGETNNDHLIFKADPWLIAETFEETLGGNQQEPIDANEPDDDLSFDHDAETFEETLGGNQQEPIDADEPDDDLSFDNDGQQEVLEEIEETFSDDEDKRGVLEESHTASESIDNSVESSSTTADETSPASPTSNETTSPHGQGFLNKSGEWIIKVLLILMSGFLFAKIPLMGTKPEQERYGGSKREDRPPSSSDVCTFMDLCRARLKRTGRCRRSKDDIVHAKAEYYDCYTKDDLFFICQFLNVANLSKLSRRGKNYMMNELIHGYEDLLWGFTMAEIQSILQVHGVYYKSSTNKTTLVELAVEAGF